MARNKKSPFAGKVKRNVAKQKMDASVGYIKLPNNVKLYTPTGGEREKFDVIPFEITSTSHMDLAENLQVGDVWYKHPFKVHKGLGADNEKAICLSTFGEQCPICEYRKKRAKEGADWEELKEFKPSLRNLYYVIPRGVKKTEEIIHIMDMSQHLFQNLLNDEVEENDDYEIFPDSSEDGLTLKVRWNEETFGKFTYAEAGRIDFLKRDEPIEDDLLDGLFPLDKCLKRLTYEQLENLFLGTDNVADAASEENTNGVDFGADLTWDELKEMELNELVDLVEFQGIDVKNIDDLEADELRDLIAKESGIKKPRKARSAAKKETPAKKEKEEENVESEEEKAQKIADEKAAKRAEKRAKIQAEKEAAEKAKDEDELCQHGLRFGVDTDVEPSKCDDCELWDSCIDKKEESE